MTMKMRFCLKAATELEPDDLDAITASIEAYGKAGMAVELAEAAAVDDLLAQVGAERDENVQLLTAQHPDLFEPAPGQPPPVTTSGRPTKAGYTIDDPADYRIGDSMTVRYPGTKADPDGYVKSGWLVAIDGEKLTFQPNGGKAIVNVAPDRVSSVSVPFDNKKTREAQQAAIEKFQSGAVQEEVASPAPTDDDDLGGMFDDLMAEQAAPAAAEKPARAPRAPRVVGTFDEKDQFLKGFDLPQLKAMLKKLDGTPAATKTLALAQLKGYRLDELQAAAPGPRTPPTRTATQAATSAAANTGKALGNAIDGLGALFNPGKGTLGSGPVFNEETYAKAKPLFAAALANLQDAAADLREAMRSIIKMVVDKFGAETAQAMKPYVVRYIEEVRDGTADAPASTSQTQTGLPSQNEPMQEATKPEQLSLGGLDVIPASEEAFADALNGMGTAESAVDDDGELDEDLAGGGMNPDVRRFVDGESARYNATFRPETKPVSLPRVTSAKPKPAGVEFLTTEQAAERLASWKAEAMRQGDAGLNSTRTVISLFDASGVISQPWVDAGYNVYNYDLQNGTDISEFDAENLMQAHDDQQVWAIIGQPPCTDFAGSGAQWWKDKDADGRTEASNELVRQNLRTVELFRPAVWVMENPVGRIQRLNKLPDPLLSFDPWHYGDPYTKRTLLWGNFDPNLPQAPVEPTEGSKMHNLSSSAKYERSLTPEGFAYAFFMANNAQAMGESRTMAAEFPGVAAPLFDGALKAGHSAYDIKIAIEDSYYDNDLEFVRDELARLANAPKETPDVSSSDPDLERDSSDPADEAPGVGGDLFGNGPAPSPGPVGGRTGSARRGRTVDPRVPPGGATAPREPGDQSVRAGEPGDGPAEFDARDSDGARSDDPGLDGVQADAGPAGSLAEAAAGRQSDAEKRAAQRAADSVAIAPGIENIRATLPYLDPGQQEDVEKAETRFALDDGYGMLFTNGTGTGKTFTGLGIVKRAVRSGKGNILIVVPDGKIMDDWVQSGVPLGLTITPLASTKDAGTGVAITTYANLGDNNALPRRAFDHVIADEAHMLMQAAEGDDTKALDAVRALTLHPRGAGARFNKLFAKELDRRKVLEDDIKAWGKTRSMDDTTEMERASLAAKIDKAQAELDPLNAKLRAERAAVNDFVDANQGAKRPRLTALSATPFAYEKTLDWSEGYLFDYTEGYDESNRGRYGQPSPDQHFFMTHLGYSMKAGRLIKPDARVNSGQLQRQLNTWMKKRGVLSGRILDVPFDYDRRFVLVDSAVGNDIDAAIDWVREHRIATSSGRKNDDRSPNGFELLDTELSGVLYGPTGHLTRRYLLEAIKAKEVVQHVKEHMALGRKVVVFHDFKKGGAINPFDFALRGLIGETNRPEKWDDAMVSDYNAKAEAFNGAVAKFRAAFPRLGGDLLADLLSPIERFANELPQALLINGDQKKTDLLKRYKAFNDDANGPMVMLVQSDKDKGWSGHDTTGKHQRVLFNLGLPTKPTKTTQQEGRTYRIGQASDAINRYLNTGTDWEKMAFAQTIAQRASAAENLASGESARALKEGFIAAFEESGDFRAGHEGEGKGGKERDRAANNALTEFDRAKGFYWATQKKTAKTKAKEGVDYFATPEPLGLKITQWLDLRPGEDALEPSAGHGAIARWFPENTNRSAIEPSTTLGARMALVFDGKITQSRFEDLHVVNKYDGIAMNPPFGTAGRTAIDHVMKAATHLRDGGRIVALIPTGPAADKKFDAWFYAEQQRPATPLLKTGPQGPIYRGDTVSIAAFGRNTQFVVDQVDGPAGGPNFLRAKGVPKAEGINAYAVNGVIAGPRTETYRPSEGLQLVADIKLPSVTFERAGTGVMTRVVVLEKSDDAPQAAQRDLTSITDITELFDRLENLDLPARGAARVQETAPPAPAPQATKEAEKQQARAAGVEKLAAAKIPLVEHTTGKGKLLKGVVRTDITYAEAKAIDKFTFKKDGGWFIRAEHLDAMQASKPMPDLDLGGQQLGARAEFKPGAQADQATLDRLRDRLGARLGDSGLKLNAAQPANDQQREAAAMVQALSGRRVIFFQTDRGGFANGFADPAMPGVLFANIDSTRPIMALLGHELTHDMRRSNPALYDQLVRAIEPLLTGESKYVDALLKRYAARGAKAPISLDKMREELIADIVGDNWTDPAFWREVTKGRPPLFQRVLRAIRDFLDGVISKLRNERPFGSERYLSDVVAARKAVADVMAEFFAAQPAPQAQAQREAEPALSGTPEQTDTPAFRAWFGDSKVVDAEGKPRVVYHGTHAVDSARAPGKGDVKQFDRLFTTKWRRPSVDTMGSWFSTNPSEDGGAGMYAAGGNGVMYPVFLSIKNPQVTTFAQMLRRARLLANGEDDGRMVGAAEVEAYRTWLRGMGKDGIKITHDAGSESTEFEKQDAWIALEPEQVKSATGNAGTFDPASPDITLSGQSDPFYSELSRQVGALPMKAGDAAAWKQAIKGMLGKGVKADEVAWTGLDEWLDTQPGKIPKAAVQEFLNANGVQVTETVLSNEAPEFKLPRGWTVESVDEEDSDGYQVLDEDGEVRGEGDSAEEAIADAQDADERRDMAGATQYPTYQLPGGTNYREVLLTLPSSANEALHRIEERTNGLRMQISEYEDQISNSDADEDTDYLSDELADARKELASLRDEERKAIQASQATYQSNHWKGTPNVLAHIRLNDRTDADGKRVLFVEEVQSDWAQQGKKQGFREKPDPKVDELREERKRRVLRLEMLQPGADGYADAMRSLTDINAELHARGAQLHSAADVQTHIPTAPFVGKTDAWVALALKRVIKLAVDEGYDRVAFINGTQSAERYDLSKQISVIRWDTSKNPKDGGEVRRVVIEPKDSTPIPLVVDVDTGIVRNNKASAEFAGKPLDEVVGKDIAKYILETEDDALRGLGLRMGGEGMKAFYDKIVPSVLKDVLKKVGGGKVGEVQISAKDGRFGGEQSFDPQTATVVASMGAFEVRAGGRTIRTFGSRAEAEQYVGSAATLTQPGFDITDAMREKASGGLPMFDIQHTPEEEAALRRAGIDTTSGLRRAGQKINRAYRLMIEALRDNWGRQFQQAALDQFTGIKLAIQNIGGLPVDQDPYVAARLANGGTSSVMRGLMLHGQARWAANGQHLEKIPDTEGLLDILSPLGDGLNDFFGWMIGNRAERLMREGRENNFTPDQIKALKGLNRGREAEFRKAALAYGAFKRSVLDIAEQAGLLDKDARAVWDHADYIPFYRQIDEAATFSATGKKGLAGQSSGIRTLKGGAAALNDPMENLLMNFSRLVDASLKNNALLKTIDVLEAAGSDITTKVGYDMKGVIVPAAQVKKTLIANGTPPDVLDAIPPDVFEGMAKMWSIQAPSAPDVVRVMRNGKPEFRKVNDPLLLKALTSFVPFDFPGLGAARAFKRVLTGAVTATPAFMLRNFIRDSGATIMIGRDGWNPVPKLIGAGTGLYKSLTETGLSEAMLFAGASFQGQQNAADPKGSAASMRRALRRKGMSASSVSGFMRSVVDTPAKGWDAFRHVGESIENANREAVGEAALKAGRGMTAAAYESKDLMDFSLRGSSPIYQVLADVLPFFNAHVQGMYRLGRADPKKVALYGTLMMAASVALAMANADWPEYEELQDWDKDTNWHMRIAGKHVRIPKPFELGVVFATIPERIFRYAMDNEAANKWMADVLGYKGPLGSDSGKKFAKRVWSNIRDQLAMNPTPQIIKPAVEAWANKNTFRDQPIENLGDENKLPSSRYGPSTSATVVKAVQAAPDFFDKIELGPKKIEFLIGGYLGSTGMYALGLTDSVVRALDGAPPRPTARIDELPVVGSFFRNDPARSTVFESDFYALRDEVNKVYATMNDRVKNKGDQAGAEAIASKNEAKLGVRKTLEHAAKTLKGMNKERDRIYADREMTPDQKRAALDELQVQKNALTRGVMTSEGVRAAQR